MTTNSEYLFKLAHEAPDELAAWFSATRGGLDAPKEEDGGNDEFPPENVVSVAERARNANKAAQVVPEEHVRDLTETMDSREKLEADALDFCTRLFEKGRLFAIGLVLSSCDGSEQHDELIKLLDRQAEITRRTEQAEWIKQANGLIHEANARAAELKAERDEWRTKCETREIAYKQADAERKRYSEQIDELIAERDEAVEAYDAHMAAHDAWHEAEDIEYTRNRFAVVVQAKDERIAKLEAERDYWRDQVERCVAAAAKPERHAEGVMAYPRDELRFAEPALLVVDAIDSLRDFHADDRIANKRLDAECDALARDLEESEKLRDELREKLSAAIGHAVEITRLQDLEED